MPEIQLHRKQSEAFRSKATEILYGGAAGGGKSYLLRVEAVFFSLQYPGTQTYLFRRHYGDLVKNHIEGPGGFRNMLGEYLEKRLCRLSVSPPAIRFSNGSVIHLCHCQYDRDVLRYQGAEIHLLLMDELTHFSETVYRFLRSRCRMPGGGEKGLPRILCGANPGGPGHNWVKAFFIDNALPFSLRRMPPEEGGMLRQYIPAKLEDNPSLNREEYEERLRGLRNPFLVKAMLDGSWDIVAGGMFDDLWDPAVHVVDPFPIPPGWRIDRSFDWGFSKPYSVGYWAESDGSDYQAEDGTCHHTVRGDLFRIGELYGWNGHADEGARHTPREVGSLILEKERLLNLVSRVQPGPADNSIFDSSGGPSVASDLERTGIRFLRSDKAPGSRKRGWVMLSQRLKNGRKHEEKSLFVFSTCGHFIRTVPVLPRSEKDPDDVDTFAEDHVADETRYRILASEPKKSSTGGFLF